MLNKTEYDKVSKQYFKTLDQYVPVVDRVHGGSHPEFHNVRELYNDIVDLSKGPEAQKAGLYDVFDNLRKITSDYTVPDDVCESYEAVYKMLEELDLACRNSY